MKKELTIDERIIKFLGLDHKMCGFEDHQQLFYQIRAVLKEREEDNINLEELLGLFQISLAKREKRHTNLKLFYNWLMDFRVDQEDMNLYYIYCDVAQQLDAPDPDPADFAGAGQNLRKRLDEWRQVGKTKNDFQQILYDYCEGMIRMCADGDAFTQERLHSPAMLFKRFGWNLWERYVDQRWSGQMNYLEFTDEYLAAEEKRIEALSYIYHNFSYLVYRKRWSEKKKMWYLRQICRTNEEWDTFELCEKIKEFERQGKCPLESFFTYNEEESET